MVNCVGRASLGGGNVIGSTPQTGLISMTATNASATATITSVDTSLAVVFLGGIRTSNGLGNDHDSTAKKELTNATTVTVDRDTNATLGSVFTEFSVVEFNTSVIESIQKGTIVLTGVSSNTGTITSVDTTKSFLIYNGARSTDGTDSPTTRLCTIKLTNATTVTADFGTATGNKEAKFTVIEFK